MSSEALASLTEFYSDSDGDEERGRLDMSESPSASSSHSSYKGPPAKRPNSTLVSYVDDTLVSDEEVVSGLKRTVHSTHKPDKMGPSIKILTKKGDVELPPEPTGKCSPELQEKIVWLMKEMKSKGQDMNQMIQRRKSFRNPSIYEKLIQFCSINEFGTNYSPDVYDPLKWDKGSYYDELAKVQKQEMDQREKDRRDRTKVEVLMGTKKSLNGNGNSEEDIKKRKSKWDQVGASNMSLQKPPAPVLTTAVTGTKGTVISAFGSLTKKK